MDIKLHNCGQHQGRDYKLFNDLIMKYIPIYEDETYYQLLIIIILKYNSKNIYLFNGGKFDPKEEQDNIEY